MAYITSSTANRLREVMAMYSALVRLHPAYFASYCLGPQCYGTLATRRESRERAGAHDVWNRG